MMKGFLKSGKWIGLIVVGLLFAGCYGGGGGDSSSEAAVATSSQTGVSAIPITINPGTHQMTIGNGSGSGVYTTPDGHDVEITNGTTSLPLCSGVGPDVQCWIRLINRDNDEYMYNASIIASNCQGCLTAQIDNPDMVNGDTVGVCTGNTTYNPTTGDFTGDLGCGPSVVVNGTEICYVEDGQHRTQPFPYNQKGCKVHYLVNDQKKPFQILWPDCGSQSMIWDFGGQGPKYTFYGTVKAQWNQQDPTGDGDPATLGDNDTRYDFDMKSTYYLMVTDLDNNPGIGAQANGQAWLLEGSYLRSNVLSGYGATGSNVLAEGRYFAVNVALEYENRIESQIMGDNVRFSTNPNGMYEYYNQYAYTFRFNPNVVARVAKQHKTAGGTVVRVGAKTLCGPLATQCLAGLPTFTGLETIQEGVNAYGGEGWVAMYAGLAGNYDFFYAGYYYFTFYGGKDVLSGAYSGSNYVMFPKFNAHHGVARIRAVPGSTIFMNGYTVLPSTAILQDGPDAAPDMELAMYYMYVLPGTSGMGGEFWIDTYSTATSLNISATGPTLYPSGTSFGSDDWTSICAPMTPGFIDPVHLGCDIAGHSQSDYTIYASVENVNVNITHSGNKMFGGTLDGKGAPQQWSAHICVQ